MTKTTGNFTDFVSFSRASGGTYLDSDGLIKTAATNVPRVEYDASGNLKGLLIEGARTNFVTYSEALASSPWVVSAPSATVTANNKIAPSGSQTATKISTASDFAGITAAVAAGTTIASKSFTVSVWVYADTTFTFDIRTRGAGSVQEPQNTTVSTVAGEWVRVSSTHTFTASADGTTVVVFLYTSNFSTTSSSNTLWFWGAQLEVGAFPTSYIPTSGATATRASDICSMPVSAFGHNPNGHTFVVEANGPSAYDPVTVANFFAFSIGNATNVSREIIRVFSSTSSSVGVLDGLVVDSNVWQFDSIGVASFAAGTSFKAALAAKKDNFAFMSNGQASVDVDTSGTLATDYTTLYVGSSPESTRLNGHIKSIRYFPRRLTNAQIQALTA